MYLHGWKLHEIHASPGLESGVREVFELLGSTEREIAAGRLAGATSGGLVRMDMADLDERTDDRRMSNSTSRTTRDNESGKKHDRRINRRLARVVGFNLLRGAASATGGAIVSGIILWLRSG